MKGKAVVLVGVCFTSVFAPASHAKADVGGSLCKYPGVGVAVNVGGVDGFFCDYPTEINGAHWHCQGGGAGLGLASTGVAIGGMGTLGIGGVGQGVGGLSCNWRCPDNTDAPAPNPPGAWKDYLVPMNTTNYCKDHMEPAGFWSAPVLPTEGIPPAGEPAPQPGETLPAQPTPPSQPVAPELAPGEPNP